MKYQIAGTQSVSIHIAGDRNLARQLLQKFVMEGLCVSVIDEDYIYTGGMQTGVRVTLINYPRFPKSPWEITSKAMELAGFLMIEMSQRSCTVVDTAGDSYYLTNPDLENIEK